MSDLTSQDIDNLSAQLQRAAGNIGDYTQRLNRDRSEQRLERDLFKQKANTAAEAIGTLGKSASDAHNYLARIVGGTILGGAFAKLINVGNEMTSTYRELAANGHTFNGSILEMSLQAARAGMPLEDFAAAVSKNSAVVKQLASKDFAGLQKQLRSSMMEHGMFAMSMGQMTNFSFEYLETSRKTGAIQNMSNLDHAKQMTNLAGITQNLSEVTGKAREEIAQLANSAIQSSLAMSRIRSMSDKAGVEANARLQSAATILAAQTGEAGEFLTGALAETFGTGGLSEFTTQGQTMINAGMGHLASSFSNLANNLSDENTVSTMENFRKEVGQNLPALRALALSSGEGGNAARELLRVHSQMAKFTKEDLRKKITEQDGITKLFTTFSTAWDQMIGTFRTGFLEGLKPLFASVGDFTKTGAFERINSSMESFGLKLGGFFAWAFSESTMESVGKGISMFGDFLFNTDWLAIGSVIASVAGGFAIFKLMNFAPIAAALTIFGTSLGGIISILAEYPNALSAALIGFGAVAIALKGLSAFSKLKDIFSDKIINAKTVIVNGGASGGAVDDLMGGDLDGNGKKKKGSKASRLRNIRKGGKLGLLRSLGGAGADAVGTASKGGLLKGAGKSILKKIPGLGILAGLGFGAQRAFSGDLLGGGAEVLSGLASTIPGIGTAASLAIDGGLAARDAGIMGGKGTGGPSKLGKMAKVAAYGGAGVGIGAAGLAMTDYLSTDTASKSNPPDPSLVKKLEELITISKETNDIMIGVSKAQTQIMREQRNSLINIARNSA